METRRNAVLFGPVEVLVPTVDGESTENTCQVSVHAVKSKTFLREAAFVFPNVPLNTLIAISTMQHAKLDLVRFGDEVEAEKDRLLISFFDLANHLRRELSEKMNYWCDYIDPSSGLPVCSDGQNMFNEVDCAQSLLGYRIMNAGCCKILLHPQWGSAVYPASIFTTAPAECVLAVLAALPRARSTEQDDVSTYVTGDDEIQVTHCQSLSS